MEWYALFVETGKEDFVQTMIRRLFNEAEIRAIVPKRRLQEKKQGQIHEVCRTVFPGYIFVNTRMNIKTYYKLKEIPSYYRLLNRYKYSEVKTKEFDLEEDREEFLQKYPFSKIEFDEMKAILQLMDQDEVIDYSTVYMKDAKIIVCSGPLKGKEGTIKKIDKRKKRARIVLNFMGNELVLDVGIELLEVSKSIES